VTNDKQKRRPSQNTVVLAEYRLLNALIKNSSFRDDTRISEDLFIDIPAKSAYEAIMNLASKGIEITPASLLQEAGNIDYNVSQQVVQTIWNIDPEGASSLDDILAVLKTATLKDDLIVKIDELKKNVEQPGNIDNTELSSKIYSLDETLQNSTKRESPLMSFTEWADAYMETLEERKAGKKYSYGDVLLDEYLYKGAYPGAITMVCASTNMGKSTFVLSLINNLLENNSPCMYLSLEMSAEDTMDRLISMRCGISNEDLYNNESNNMDAIIETVKKEREALANRKNFYFCDDPDIDMIKLRKLIKEFKQRSKCNYCLVAIDLLTQMKGFMSTKNGMNTATGMEMAMNELNALAKSENVHIIGVAQFNRESDNVKIRDLQDIEECRPNIASVKGSSSMVERARVCLGIFRKYYYISRYLSNDEEAMAQDDVMEVQVLKNSNGPSGKTFRYMFDGDHFKLIPLADEEQVKLDALKEIEF
jgi:replicative DNA helicase